MQILSRTIDVDGLKVFCREGSAPSRGTSTSRSTASQHSRSGIRPCSPYFFEVFPNKENWDDYLDNAEMLRPELEQVEGFVDNIRYKSLTREGWILSLSNWRDEKSLVRWRTRMRHHEVQQKGRDEILADYHLRVGQITADNQVPAGYALTEQRLDETEVGEGTTVTLINATRFAEWKQTNNPYDCAEWLGLNPWAADITSWDIF